MLDEFAVLDSDGGDSFGGGGGSERDGAPGRKPRSRSGDVIGTGTGGDIGGGGDPVGTGKRRGRPRKVSELVGEFPGPPVAKTTRARKQGPDLKALVDTTIVGLFGLVAVATAHEHWLKDREDVMAITGPLNAWIDQLPSKTLKKIEANLAPTLFVVGLATVIGPDAVLEARIRYEQKRSRNSVSRSRQAPGEGAIPFAERPSNGNRGADRDGGGNQGWHSGIPTVPAIGSDYDV